MMVGRSALLILAVAVASIALAGLADAAPTCRTNDEVAGTVAALPKVGAAIEPGHTLHILAIGSATLFGPEASLLQVGTPVGAAPPTPREASNLAFPRQMVAALQADLPGVKVDIVVRGGRGLTAAEMLAILKRELAASSYQLVLWQTGTVEAVKNSPPNEFAQILSEGVEAVEAADANLILIDPQYSRFLQANSNLDPYTQAMQQAASFPGVLLFHRFDLMRAWAADGQIDLERTPKADRKRVVEDLHACLGASLARMVIAGARS